MITVGRVCIKTAGRDAGKKCVVTEILDANQVMIAGETRNRKCSIAHLEPLEQEVKIKPQAGAVELEKALQSVGISLRKSKKSPAAEKPSTDASHKVPSVTKSKK